MKKIINETFIPPCPVPMLPLCKYVRIGRNLDSLYFQFKSGLVIAYYNEVTEDLIQF